MQAIRIPNYDFRKLSVGKILSEKARSSSGSIELSETTGFLQNQFAVLGYDNPRENAEISHILQVDGNTLNVSKLAYEHQKDFLVFPMPYDQIELYKSRDGGSMQLFERKVMDLEGPYTVFFDENAEKGDEYEYKYRNSITEADSGGLSSDGVEFYRAKDPYVSPEDAIRYMGASSGFSEEDPNDIALFSILCDAYSDELDHLVGRYKNERLWYHYENVVIPVSRIRKNGKVRIAQGNEKPVKRVIQASLVNPRTGESIEIQKPYEVLSGGIVSLPRIALEARFSENMRLHMTVQVGFFESSNVPQDIRRIVCEAISMHIRREDMIKRYVHHVSDLVSGETGSDAFVRQKTVGKYTKMYFESIAESNGQRVNARALEAMNIQYESSLIKNNMHIIKQYMQTISFNFV